MTLYPNERYLRNALREGYEFEKDYTWDEVINIKVPEEDESFPFSATQGNTESTVEGEGDETTTTEDGEDLTDETTESDGSDVSNFIFWADQQKIVP